MTLNAVLFQQLEQYGLSNPALEQLLALCQADEDGSITWHVARTRGLVKFEVRRYGSMSDLKRMRAVTKDLAPHTKNSP